MNSTLGTVNALKTISGKRTSPRLRICDERHHQRVKKEHERFFFRDISASVHAAESRANPREQRIAEPLSAFTVPLLWITITVSLQEGSYANESAWIDPRMASTVVGDITRVRRVLLNVLNNAIKFTSSGEIYLQVEPSVDLDNMIHFCVEDTGLGIQQADFGPGVYIYRPLDGMLQGRESHYEVFLLRKTQG